MTLACSLAVLLLAGCQTVGINTGADKTEWLILHPGKPARIMTNVTVPCKLLSGETVLDQDIGYWVAMPPEHWESLQREFKRLQEKAEKQ